MLKTKRMFVTLLISAMFLIGGAFTALAAAPDGSFDAFEGNTIVGWAWDSSMPNTGVPVSVTITNKETGEQVKSYHQTAVTYRSDLKENGIGNGNHGFRISIKTAAENIAAEGNHEHTGLKSLGFFHTTGYCPCRQCSEGWGRHTSTGTIATSGRTIAVDPRVIPYGSKVMIGGVIYTAEDRGGGVKGNHVDIFFDTHAQTRQHGKQTQEVFLVLG